jgi:hypothetical protein
MVSFSNNIIVLLLIIFQILYIIMCKYILLFVNKNQDIAKIEGKLMTN